MSSILMGVFWDLGESSAVRYGIRTERRLLMSGCLYRLDLERRHDFCGFSPLRWEVFLSVMRRGDR